MSAGLFTPFTVGFAVALIPAAWIYFASYKSEDERLAELKRRGYIDNAQLPRTNSAANQQLLNSIFQNRHEPDLYTALGEINRRAPSTIPMLTPPEAASPSASPVTTTPVTAELAPVLAERRAEDNQAP